MTLASCFSTYSYVYICMIMRTKGLKSEKGCYKYTDAQLYLIYLTINMVRVFKHFRDI